MKFAIIGRKFGMNYARLLRKKGIEHIIVNQEEANLAFLPDIDCVIIASPPITHFGYIKEALGRRKHVLVEKPMVLTVSEAKQIRGFIRDRVFMVAHQYRYNLSLLTLVGRIKMGEIGRLVEVHMSHYYPSPRKDIGVYWDAASHEFSVLDLFKEMPKLQLRFGIGTKRVFWKFIGEKGSIVFQDLPIKEPMEVELEHFIGCVENGTIPSTDIEHGIRVIENMEKYETQYTV